MDMNKIDEIVEDLQRLKDELAVKANLGIKEAQEELEKLEPHYETFKDRVAKVADVAGDTASQLKTAAELGIDAKSSDDLKATLELTGEELKKSFSKIKDILS
ncbi:hypothetical protein MNB_SV-6-41 [hydrothermal vent metagenome]|uniref:Uncharacterized protein n=1 Tax=hydrothermal vent metagenome TaxID=652676 RepID=A0A1W1BI52_9ZZZZ